MRSLPAGRSDAQHEPEQCRRPASAASPAPPLGAHRGHHSERAQVIVSPMRERNWVQNLLVDAVCVRRSRDSREPSRACHVEDPDKVADVMAYYRGGACTRRHDMYLGNEAFPPVTARATRLRSEEDQRTAAATVATRRSSAGRCCRPLRWSGGRVPRIWRWSASRRHWTATTFGVNLRVGRLLRPGSY